MKEMFRKPMALVMIGYGLTAWGYTANVWRAVDGNWNGKYSEVAHWSRGHLPNADEDAVFENQSVPYTVEIDGDYSGFQFTKIGNSSGEVVGQAVTLAGTGSLSPNQPAFYVYTGRKVILGGQFRFLGSGLNLYDGASLTLTNSATFMAATGGKATINSEATFTLAGGTFNGYFAPAGSVTSTNSTISITGGVWNHVLGNQAALPASFRPSFTGGRINSSLQLHEVRLLPQGSAEMHNTLAGSNGPYSLTLGSAGTNVFSGTVYATNAVEGAGPAFRVTEPQAFVGGGTLHAGWFMPYYDGVSVFDLARITVGKLVYPKSTTIVEFPGDTMFGASGDWSWQVQPKEIRPYGALTLDTTDAFDGSTARRVLLHAVAPQLGSALKSTGVGTATFRFAFLNPIALLARELDFAAAQTVFSADSLRNDTALDYAVRVGRFRLGAGKKLTLFPARNYIDSTLPPEVDETAEITLDLTGLAALDGKDMTAGRLVYPVVTTSSGTGVPFERFRIVNNPGTWRLCKCGPTVYLRDDTAKRVNPSAFLWTGAADGDWSNTDNWQGGAVPTASSVVYLDVNDSNSVITIPAAGASITRLSGGGVSDSDGISTWYRSCGAFVVRGGTLTISGATSGNYNAGIYCLGLLPIVFENDVVGSGTTFGPLAYKGVSFLGNLTAKTFCPCGDIRIGGTATCTTLSPVESYTAQCRPTSLTILPGGSFTTTAQSSHLGAPFSFNVMSNGTCAIPANGANTFNFMTKSNGTHLVDGTLTFGLPIGLHTNAQTFAGSGRVNFKEVLAFGNRVTPLRATAGITFAPEAFYTIGRNDYRASAMRLEVPAVQTATLAPRADLVYGLAAGVTPIGSTAADRALQLGLRSTLRVVCADADDATVARNVTFSDPIAAAPMAQVVKTGAGTLTLASAENAFAKKAGLDVRTGTLAYTCNQVLGTLKMAVGTALSLSVADGALPTLTVADDVDLSGVVLSVANKDTAAFLRGHDQVIIKVSPGCHITGTVTLPMDGTVKIEATDEGGEALTYRLPVGLTMYFR